MPRIKYSTLISALAGKSNGSVFSKNQGGSYFRTNKAGYGLKTNAQSQNQGKFKTIGRKWSQLSDSEREAWNSAVVNYPTKNIFGDERSPTGYELFCRVNGGLVARNMPEKILPEMPSVLPTISSIEWDTSDDFLYQSNNSFGNKDIPVSAGHTSLFWELDSGTMDIADCSFFEVNVDSGLMLDRYSIGGGIFSAECLSTGPMPILQMSFVKTGLNSCKMVISYVTMDGDFQQEFLLNNRDFSNGFNLKFGFRTTVPRGGYVCFNNEVIEGEAPIISGTHSDFNVTGIIFFIENSSFSNSFQCNFLSAFQYYQYGVKVEDKLSCYANDLMPFVIGIKEQSEPLLTVFGNQPDFLPVQIVYGDGSYPVEQLIKQTQIIPTPSVWLNLIGDVISGFDVDVSTSKPVSSGRGLKSVDYVKIDSFEYTGSETVFLSNSLKGKWGYFSQGSDFNMVIRLFDKIAGVVYLPTAVNKPNKKTRFKAGAELTGKVGKS